jgi:hypothetical protein
MDADIKIIDLTKSEKPAIVVVDLTTPGATIRIEGEIPRRPATFYFTPDGGIQSNCPGGVCPTPQVQTKPRFRGILGR